MARKPKAFTPGLGDVRRALRDRFGSSTADEVAEHLRTSRESVLPCCEALVASGWLTTVPDGRAVVYVMTAAGRAQMSEER